MASSAKNTDMICIKSASGRKGIHHLAYEVDDLDARLAALKEAGAPLINETPVKGSRGTGGQGFLVLSARFAGVHMEIEHSGHEHAAVAVRDDDIARRFESVADLLDDPGIPH